MRAKKSNMKATGIVRNLDELGRIVIPKEIRRTLCIDVGNPIEIFMDGDAVILKKFNSTGDVEKLIDNFERSLRMKETIVPSEKIHALLEKAEEMRDIINHRMK